MPKPPPTYRAYTVRRANDENKKDSWIAIGAAWPHRDQKGIDLILDALPIDGHIVLRINEPQFNEPRKEKAPERRTYTNKTPRTNDRSANTTQRWRKS